MCSRLISAVSEVFHYSTITLCLIYDGHHPVGLANHHCGGLIVRLSINGCLAMNSHALSLSSKRTKYLFSANKDIHVSHITMSYVIFTTSYSKILSQVENASETVPVEIIARPKGKDMESLTIKPPQR